MNVYESIMKGLNEALEYEKGNLTNVKTNKVTVSLLPHYTKDVVKNIRNRLHLTQKVFASVVGVSQKTVEAWECGKNIPHGPAQRILEILQKDSKVLTKCNIIKSEKPAVKITAGKVTKKVVANKIP